MIVMCTLDIEFHISDSSCKNRSRSDVFQSYKSSPSNSDVCVESRKRKRISTANILDGLLNELFLLKPFPANKTFRSRTLQPLVLIPRSCLPLSFLDISSSASFIGETRLFEAHIKALESEEEFGSQPMVLVARDEESRALFALERESRGLYALCQIGLWANLQQLYDVAVASKLGFSKVVSQPAFSLNTQSIKSRSSTSNELKKRLAIEAIQSMVRKSSIQPDTEPHLSSKDLEAPLTGTESCLDSIPKCQAPDEKSSSQISLSEIFENVRMQYFDTLYLSRVSLAYFAKGPLSRARAALYPDSISKSDQNDYISFLQTLIIPIPLMDRKYRDGVPNCLLQSNVLGLDVNNTDDVQKKKKVKTSKLGKNGLYPSEDLLIQKWWATHDDDNNANLIVTESLREHLTKTRISQLRIRETLLQIIIMLEVLALQPPFQLTEETCQPLATEIFNESRSGKKTKKPENLLTLIDIHIDRLCIWQSVVLEPHEITSMKTQHQSKINNESDSRASDTENLLRDFSVDVILPFFSSRLPTHCASINRKLGVSVVIAGNTNNSKSSCKSAALLRPGAATNRSLPGKPRPSLKRALKDERKKRSVSQSHDKAISLMKSASMPVLSIVNNTCRENSSVTNIPFRGTHNLNPASSLKLKRSLQREACFTTTDFSRDSRDNKNAIVEAELKDAIAALRKPNRSLSTKDVNYSASIRASNLSHARTSKKSPDITFRKGVQILATPKTHRQKLIIDKSRNSCPRVEKESPTSDLPISSSIPLSDSINMGEYFDSRDPLLRSIQATPTRKSELSIKEEIEGNFEVDDIDHSSPLYACRSSAKLFGSVSNPSRKGIGTSRAPDSMTMPIKDKDKESSRDQVWLQLKCDKTDALDVGIESCSNIYRALGWDDELS